MSAVPHGAVLSGIANLDQILAVARVLPVFPCLRNDQVVEVDGKKRTYRAKSPHVSGGLHAASKDPEVISEWWGRWPDAYVGVPTGSASGIIAIDYDIGKKQPATDDWVREHSDALLSSRTHSTLRGGKHWVFRNPEGKKYRTGAGLTLGGILRPGLDLRAEGGYIIWWPVHGGSVGDNQKAPVLPPDLIDDRLIGPEIGPSEAIVKASPEQWKIEMPKVAEALKFISPNGRDEWLVVGMGIHRHSQGSDEGFQLWHEWSSTASSGYEGIEDCRYAWEHFNHDTAKPVGIGSIFHLAKDAGYKASQILQGGTDVIKRRRDSIPEPVEIQDPAIVNAIHEGGPLPAHLLINGTDMHAARRFSERHGDNVRYSREASWLVWNAGRWRADEKGVMVAALVKESAEALYDEVRIAGSDKRHEIYKTAKLYLQRRAIEAVIWLARSEPGIPVELITFDANPWIINVQNGIVDLKTGKLLPHDREARCSMIAGTSHDENATCPRWEQFIGEVCLGNTDLMDYMQRVCGYLLTANISEQCLFFLHGGGANGKTTFVETIMRLMGDYATAGEPELLMTRKMQGIPADVAKLRGARAVFLNEVNQGHRFDEAKLKNLTGGDTLEARFMRENFFTFKPTHKLMLRGNHKPTVNGTDEGIWRRLKLIPFDLRLEENQKDRTLEETLAGEMPGILNWMIAGCLAWQKDGLKTPPVVSDAIAEYREDSDTMARFLDEKCDISPSGQVKSGALYEAYTDYCEKNHERALSAREFPHEIERRIKGAKRAKTNGVRVMLGLSLKTQDTWSSSYDK